MSLCYCFYLLFCLFKINKILSKTIRLCCCFIFRKSSPIKDCTCKDLLNRRKERKKNNNLFSVPHHIVCLQTLSFLLFSLFVSKVYNLLSFRHHSERCFLFFFFFFYFYFFFFFFFCLELYFKCKYFVLFDHILSETICLFCFRVLLSKKLP